MKIDDSMGAPASGMSIGAAGDVKNVHSPRGAAKHSLVARMPRDVIAEQMADAFAPPLSAASASIIFCATNLNAGNGGIPKSDSITSVSVARLLIFRKISRNADDQIAALSYSLPG